MEAPSAFWRWLSPWEPCLARSGHETGAVDQIAVKMLNPSLQSARIMPSVLRGWSVRYRCSLKWLIVLLISVAFSMARHTGTNLVKLVIPLFAGVAAAACVLVRDRSASAAQQMNADWLDDPDWPCATNPGMIIAGPLGNSISRYVELHIPDDISEPHLGEAQNAVLPDSACR